MTGALIILAVTIVAGILLAIFDRRKASAARTDDDSEAKAGAAAEEGANEECCGMHIVCEKDTLSPFTTEIVYYDDEELDRFVGRSEDAYSEEEIEEIRDVLLTLRAGEIAGWSRSLQLRGIILPEIVRQELLMLVAEARINAEIGK